MPRSSALTADATPTSIYGTLWRLGWPLALTVQLATLSEILIVYWLGRLLGSPALAVEATMRHAFVSTGWAMAGVATGVSVLVAQSIGAKDGRGLAILVNGLA